MEAIPRQMRCIKHDLKAKLSTMIMRGEIVKTPHSFIVIHKD
jgi:hypothetical protein